MLRLLGALGCFAVLCACANENAPPRVEQTPVDFETAELSELVRQVCAADSGEYTVEACIIEYQSDVLTFATQAVDSDSCFQAFLEGLRCEAVQGSAADDRCYGTIDFHDRCAGAQELARAKIPDDARAIWEDNCRSENSCFAISVERCLLYRYVRSEVYRLERGDSCTALQLAYRNCVAEQPCRETEPCSGLRRDEIDACDYPQTGK